MVIKLFTMYLRSLARHINQWRQLSNIFCDINTKSESENTGPFCLTIEVIN
jgi:hypothetical protein